MSDYQPIDLAGICYVGVAFFGDAATPAIGSQTFHGLPFLSGTVVIPHLPNPNCEPAALIATGRADAVEMLNHGVYPHLEYYRYFN